MEILELIRQPWPWYIAGPLVGLTVPALILGNKSFGISGTLRHTCAMYASIPFYI
jgi:tRNA G18 (ribose-2'-O)-methylase SpoU